MRSINELKNNKKSLLLIFCNSIIALLSFISFTWLIFYVYSERLTLLSPISGLGAKNQGSSPSYVIVEIFFQFCIFLGSIMYLSGVFEETKKMLKFDKGKLESLKWLVVLITIILFANFYDKVINSNYIHH